MLCLFSIRAWWRRITPFSPVHESFEDLTSGARWLRWGAVAHLSCLALGGGIAVVTDCRNRLELRRPRASSYR